MFFTEESKYPFAANTQQVSRPAQPQPNVKLSVEEEKKAKGKARIKSLLEYAEKSHNCVFPEDTAKQLLKCAYKLELYPTKQTFDGLVKQWEIWKEFLSEDCRNDFILASLKDMFRIQASAVSSSIELQSYFGNIPGVKVVKQPPRFFSSCVCLTGTVLKNGVAF